MYTRKKIKPGDTIGILGGGQLARLLAISAYQLGLNVCIWCQNKEEPAALICPNVIVAPFDCIDSLIKFISLVDVITLETENIPVHLVEYLECYRPVNPSSKVLKITQDKLLEKDFINKCRNNFTTGYYPVNSLEDLTTVLINHPGSYVLKTRTLGYDGKGQVVIKSVNDAEKAWNYISQQPAILEKFFNYTYEMSIIAARSITGDIKMYDAAINMHKDQILVSSVIDNITIPKNLKNQAKEQVIHILQELNYVGVIGVEFFVNVLNSKNFQFVINELAPRVHNTGHWTIDACYTSQFEQHIRAVCGWDLKPTTKHSEALMVNLLGNDINEWDDLINHPTTFVYLYGKKEIKNKRKMGHYTELFPLLKKDR